MLVKAARDVFRAPRQKRRERQAMALSTTDTTGVAAPSDTLSTGGASASSTVAGTGECQGDGHQQGAEGPSDGQTHGQTGSGDDAATPNSLRLKAKAASHAPRSVSFQAPAAAEAAKRPRGKGNGKSVVHTNLRWQQDSMYVAAVRAEDTAAARESRTKSSVFFRVSCCLIMRMDLCFQKLVCRDQ
jgi:hypothetical protein